MDPYDDAKANAHNAELPDYQLPPVDGLDLWPLLSGSPGAAAGPHAELALSSTALLDVASGLKIIVGKQNPAGWSAYLFPNSTSVDSDATYAVNCSAGCLFNVSSDPSEHFDLGEELPVLRDELMARLAAANEGVFQNSDVNEDSCPPGYNDRPDAADDLSGGGDDVEDLPCACWMGANKYGGFLGPYQEVEV